MEIRRKVFSLLQDENGEERYYSTNEFEMEFDEETGEKMFSEKEEEKKKKGMSTAGKVALGTGAGLVVAPAAAYGGGKLLNNAMQKKYDKLLAAGDEAGIKALDATRLGKLNSKVGKIIRDVETKASDAAHYIGEAAGKSKVWIKDTTGNWIKVSKESLGKAWDATTNAVKGAAEKTKDAAGKAVDSSKGFISKNWERTKRLYKGTSKYGKKGQIVAIGAPAFAAAGAAGYGVYKGAKNRKNKKNED